MIYGRHVLIGENCKKNWSAITRISGFKILMCLSCFTLSRMPRLWSHSMDFFAHSLQALERMLYFFRLWYSSCTVSGETQPRSHCNDFNAFSCRPLDSNQIGVSGICKNPYSIFNRCSYDCGYEILTNIAAVKTQSGTVTQIKAVVRQGRKAPMKKIPNWPILLNIPADESKIPRIDVSLWLNQHWNLKKEFSKLNRNISIVLTLLHPYKLKMQLPSGQARDPLTWTQYWLRWVSLQSPT